MISSNHLAGFVMQKIITQIIFVLIVGLGVGFGAGFASSMVVKCPGSIVSEAQVRQTVYDLRIVNQRLKAQNKASEDYLRVKTCNLLRKRGDPPCQ